MVGGEEINLGRGDVSIRGPSDNGLRLRGGKCEVGTTLRRERRDSSFPLSVKASLVHIITNRQKNSDKEQSVVYVHSGHDSGPQKVCECDYHFYSKV